MPLYGENPADYGAKNLERFLLPVAEQFVGYLEFYVVGSRLFIAPK